MKYKTKILAAVAVFAVLMPMLQLQSSPASAAPSADQITRCYKVYDGKATGAGTVNDLNTAKYAKSKCDTSDGGPCTFSGGDQGGTVSCTAPAADPADSSQSCQAGSSTENSLEGTCVVSGAADPALNACGSSTSSSDGTCGITQKYLNPLIQVFSAIAGVAIAGAIAYGGILYSTSGGDSAKVSKSKNLIRNAVISFGRLCLPVYFFAMDYPRGVIRIMIKRLAVICLLVLSLAGLVMAMQNTQTFAADGCVPATGKCNNGVCKTGTFFGLVPWYQYLQLNERSSANAGAYCEPSFTILPNGKTASSIPLILLAVLDDLVRIAGLAAVGYVIWGGIRYMTSQGSPDGTKQAQETIINAVVGLVIAILATAFVSYLGGKLAGG